MKPPVYSSDWSDEVKILYQHDIFEIWDRKKAPHIWNQYHNQLDHYLNLVGDGTKTILDVGCAQGTLALLLAEKGHHVTAVDLRPEFLEYARSRHEYGDIRFLAANVLDERNPISGSNDLIFANQLIEHLVYPGQLLLRLKKLLKPGGRLIVTTPNGKYIKNNLPSFKQIGNPKDWEHKQFTADGDGHFFAYLPEELLAVFEENGYVDIETNYFETPLISGHMKFRHIHPFLPAVLLRFLDHALTALPWLGGRLSHQLMVSGYVPEVD